MSGRYQLTTEARKLAGAFDAEPLLRPYPAEEMAATPVGRFVNNPRNEGPGCVESFTDGD